MHRPPQTLTCIALALLLAGYASFAGAADSESPYFEDLPTVLTASRLPQPINEAPGAVTVIDGDFIRASGYRDLARIFRLVPGMQVGQERSDQQWVTYHGMGNTYPSEMQVLIDGRSVYSPAAFGGVDWTALPLTLDEIDRVEIMRGTNAVTYGANAFLGVINIITRHSSDYSGTRLHLAAGDSSIGDAGFTTGQRGNDASWMASASLKHDDGFDEIHDQRQVAVMSTRGDWRLNSDDELTLRLAGSSAVKGEGYTGSLFDNNGLRDSHNGDYSLDAKWTRSPAPDQELMINYYRNEQRVRDRWNAIGPGGVIVPLDRNRSSVRDHLELQHRFTPSATTQLVWGAEARRDTVHSGFLYATRDHVTTELYRAFSNLEWRFAPTWQANLGAAYEGYGGEPSHLAPRAFLNWQAAPGSTFRAGYGRAWQQRPTFEKYGDVYAYDPNTGVLLAQPYAPNPDLRQERVDSVELGYLGRFSRWNSSLDVRIFQERIGGYIIRVPADTGIPTLEPYLGTSMYINSSQPFVLRGIEYQLKARPWQGGELMFNHTLIDRHSGDEAIDARVAPYVASLSWTQHYDRVWSTQLTVYRMGPLAGGDGFVPLSNYTAKAYTTVDARIAYATRMVGKRLVLALNAINLGPHHQEIADRAEQASLATQGLTSPANPVGRMVYLSATLDF